MLYQIFKRAKRAGGGAMSTSKYAKVFGNDATLRRNVLRAFELPHYEQAIVSGTVGDHRVFEALGKMGEPAARIVLELEKKLGRKLGRAKALNLARSYLAQKERRMRMEARIPNVHYLPRNLARQALGLSVPQPQQR